MHAPNRILLTDDHRNRALKSLRNKVLVGDGCWEWTGAHSPAGYASLQIRARTCYGHRLMYELLVGPIPEGLHLDHLCRNRGCVRPSHLEPVTFRENVLRGAGRSAAQAKQTHCIHGHEFNEANTKWRSNGSRACIACVRERARKHKERRRSGDSQ